MPKASGKMLLSGNFGKKVYRIYLALLSLSIKKKKKKKERKEDHTTLAMKRYYIFSREVTLPPWFGGSPVTLKHFCRLLPKVFKTHKIAMK